MRSTQQTAAARGSAGVWLLAAAAAGILAAAAFWLYRSTGTPGPAVSGFERLASGGGEALFPRLSPDGRFVAYASPAAGDWDVYLLRVEGGEALDLTGDSPADDLHPAFSPDGESIAFSSSREGGGIFVMDATGGPARRVSAGGYHPDWSPDGTRIVYATEEPILLPSVHARRSALRVVDLATGEDRQLFAGDATMPRWSPSGARIAFWGIEGADRDIFTLAADGGGWPLGITRDAHLDWGPAWSADGRWVYFSSDRSGAMRLWRVRVDEPSGGVRGDLEEVAADAGTEAWHVSFSGDGALGVYAAIRSAAPLEADVWLMRLASD